MLDRYCVPVQPREITAAPKIGQDRAKDRAISVSGFLSARTFWLASWLVPAPKVISVSGTRRRAALAHFFFRRLEGTEGI